MEVQFFKNAAEAMGLSPYGLLIGFAGAMVSLLVVNGNGFNTRKLFLAVMSAMTLCGFFYHGISEFTDRRSVVSLATLVVSVLAPDVFILFKANGKTMTAKIIDFFSGALKRWASSALHTISDTPVRKDDNE